MRTRLTERPIAFRPEIGGNMHGYRPLCAKCGLQMGLARIELIDQPTHDLRTFECVYCSVEFTKTVPYKYNNEPPRAG